MFLVKYISVSHTFVRLVRTALIYTLSHLTVHGSLLLVLYEYDSCAKSKTAPSVEPYCICALKIKKSTARQQIQRLLDLVGLANSAAGGSPLSLCFSTIVAVNYVFLLLHFY